jgi:hypothetical protein
MRRFPALAAFPLAALLAACARQDDPACASLPGGARYCLQTTVNVAPLELQQKIDVAFKGQNETMIAQLEIDAAGMRFAGLTPLGQRLLQIEFADGQIRADGMALEKLDPALLLALIQLAWWDGASLREGLGGSAGLEEAESGRTVVKDGRPVVRIGYTLDRSPAGGVEIGLPGADVEFRIVTLDEGGTR